MSKRDYRYIDLSNNNSANMHGSVAKSYQHQDRFEPIMRSTDLLLTPISIKTDSTDLSRLCTDLLLISISAKIDSIRLYTETLLTPIAILWSSSGRT